MGLFPVAWWVLESRVVTASIPKAGNPHEVTVVGTLAKLKRKLKITNFFFRSANVFPSETGNTDF